MSATTGATTSEGFLLGSDRSNAMVWILIGVYQLAFFGKFRS
jgi:hypothetical protein